MQAKLKMATKIFVDGQKHVLVNFRLLDDTIIIVGILRRAQQDLYNGMLHKATALT